MIFVRRVLRRDRRPGPFLSGRKRRAVPLTCRAGEVPAAAMEVSDERGHHGVVAVAVADAVVVDR